MRRSYFNKFFVLGLSLLLGACNSDHAIRSPDLPSAQLNSISVSCTNTNLKVGDQSHCTALCDYLVIDKNGNGSITAPKQICRDVSWSTDNGNVVSINDSGDMTGIGPGDTQIHGTAEAGGKRGTGSVAIHVDALAVTCSIVYQKGAIVDPTPNATCTPATNFTASAPAGVTVPFRAAVRLNNGNLCYAPDAPASQSACPPNLITFTSSNVAVANFPDAASGQARTTATGTTDITATGSSPQHVTLTVTPSALNATLCVESVAVTTGCQAYGTGPVVCATDTVPNIPTGTGTFQFHARAFFNVGTTAAQVCDVTSDTAHTAWTIASNGSNAASNPSVNTTGLVSGGNAATAGASVRATYTAAAPTTGGPATGTHAFNVVTSNTLVITNNSLIVSATPVNNNSTSPDFAKPTRAACVGSYDLVEGLATPPGLPAQKRLFSVLRRCPSASVQGDGSCVEAQLSNTLEDVTNADNLPTNQIKWEVHKGYWDGHLCVESTDPIGDTVPAELGDVLAPITRYTTGAAFTGTGDGRVFTRGATPIHDNGVGVSTGPTRIGTACMTATYSEGTKFATDGMTLLVLPVTNDSLLTDPNATAAVELCNTLVPLFELGASPDGANGAVIQALSAVSTILNPILFQLTQGSEPGSGPIPIDDLLTQVITALNPITGPVSTAALDPILDAANAGVYTPLNCAIGQILLGLATGDPAQTNIAACAP